jgi:hypothetical protein
LGDGSKNTIQRSLKTNHLTLHDNILAFKTRQTFDAGSGEKLTILLLWFLEYARLTAQLTATTRSLSFTSILSFATGSTGAGTALWDVTGSCARGCR